MGGAGGGEGGEKSGPSYSTYAVQQILSTLSSNRMLAGPELVLMDTTSGSGGDERSSPTRVLVHTVEPEESKIEAVQACDTPMKDITTWLAPAGMWCS